MPRRKPLLSPDAAAFVRGESSPPAAAPASLSASGEPPAPSPAPPPSVSTDVEARIRFTVDLPRSLHKRLKLAAVDREVPMTDLAREALGEWLDAQA